MTQRLEQRNLILSLSSRNYAWFRPTVISGFVWLSAMLSLSASAEDLLSQTEYFDETQAITLFAFDDVSIPFTQNLKLKMRTPQRHPANPVVTRGPDGAVDSWAVQFYGSVIRDPDSGKFRMWYVSVSKAERLSEKLPPVSLQAPQGQGVATVPIPAIPSLVGLSLFVQAGVKPTANLSDARLTNVLRARISE